MMSRITDTFGGTRVTFSIVLWALSAMGCGPSYRPPALPANQLALVSLDSSASALDVDGLPLPPGRAGSRGIEFYVGTGCRTLTVKYEESYFIWGEKKAKKAGLGTGLAATLANSEQRDYQTMKPIRFFIPTKAGRKYWVTSTFTGDEFLPRIVESGPSGEALAKFLPDEPCKASAQP